jgi:hypothetical protein
MAQGFTVMWGEREWLGNLTTGVVILGGTALIVLAFSSHLSRKGLSRKVASHGNVAR